MAMKEFSLLPTSYISKGLRTASLPTHYSKYYLGIKLRILLGAIDSAG
jgi:hypothetical protein